MTRLGVVGCVLLFVTAGAVVGTVGGATGTGTTPVSGATTQVADGNASIVTYVGPPRLFGAVRAADSVADVRNPSFEQSAVFYERSTVALRLVAPGLAAAVAEQPGDNTTARLLALLESDSASLTTTQLTAGGVPKTLALTDRHAVTALRLGDDAVVLAVNASRLTATRDVNGNGLADDGEPVPVSPPERYRLQFTYEGTTVSTRVRAARYTATIAPDTTGPLSLFPGLNQSISGTTTVPAGTNLTVVLTTSDDAAFVRQRTVTVGTDGRFSAAFDLSSAPGEANVTVAVRRDDRTLSGRIGRIEPLSASATGPTRIAPGDPLTVRNVRFSHAGFLVVRANDAGGRVLTVRSVSPGQDGTQVVPAVRSVDRFVVQAYADIDGDGRFDPEGPDRRFDSGRARLFSVTVTRLAETPTETRRAETPTATSTTAPTPAGGTEPSTPLVVTPTTGPGFGVLTALVALLAVVAVARR